MKLHDLLGVHMPPISAATPRTKKSSLGMNSNKDDKSFLEKLELENKQEEQDDKGA